MPISAAFTVNGNANPAAHAVAYGALVTLVLQSTSGANSIVWEILGSSHADVVNPTISLSGTPNGQTATFNMVADPGGTEGRSVIVRCTITGADGTTARQSAIVGVLNGNSLLPIGAGEEYERSSTHGWAPEVNKALASTGGGGGGGYNLVQDEGSSVTVRTTLNFAGAGVTVTDSGGKTLITIPGGSSLTAPANPADDGKVAIASGGNLSYSLLADANITNATITLAKLAAIAALSIVANATNASAVPTAVAAASDNQVFRRSGTALAFGSIDLSQTNTVGSSKLAFANHADLAGLSVLARSANTSGVMAAVTGTDGQALRVSGTTLGFGSLATAAYTDASVTYAKIQNGTGLSVFGRSANSGGVNADIVGTDGQALRVSGTALGFGTLATAAYADNSVTLAKLATQAALTVLANGTNATAVPTAIAAASDGLAFVRSGTTLAFSTLAIGAFADGIITLPKLANATALSVLGNGTNASAAPTALAAGTDGNIVRRSGTAVAFGSIDLAAAGAVGSSLLAFANIANGSARSVFGRSANSSGVHASIAAGGAGQVLIDNGTTIGFGTLVAASFAAATVPLTALATQAALSVVANGTNATASPTAIAAASDGQVFLRSGTTLVFGTIATAGLTDAAVTYAKIQNGTGLSVVGRSANSAGVNADIAAATDGHILRRSGTSIGFGTVLGLYVSPDFGAQALITTSTISLGTTPAAAGAARLANNTNISWRNAGNSADVVGISVNSSNEVTLGTGPWVTVSSAAVKPSVPAVTFLDTVSSPVIGQDTRTTATTTGETFRIEGQDCSGTTAVTAGALAIRAGAATGGSGTRTGGAVTISSGTGATADGDFTLKRGAAVRFSATSTATIVADASTFVGVEHAFLASTRDVVALCKASAITTTEMPTNSGHGVVFIAKCTTAPTASPTGGITQWVDSSGNLWTRGLNGTITQLAAA